MAKQFTSYKQSVSDIDGKLREQLLLEYAPLVRFIAQSLHSKLPAHIDIEDLISEGMIGLMDAIAKFDPSRDNKFKTYAEFRIKGAILDDLRKNDWMSRSARDISKLLDKTTRNLEQRFGRRATAQEVAQDLSITLDTYFSWLNRLQCRQFMSGNFSLEESFSYGELLSDVSNTANETTLSPLEFMTHRKMCDDLADAIYRLPDSQRLVVTLCYFEGLTLAEIGHILNVSESRVSQIRSEAKAKLKVKLKAYS